MPKRTSSGKRKQRPPQDPLTLARSAYAAAQTLAPQRGKLPQTLEAVARAAHYYQSAGLDDPLCPPTTRQDQINYVDALIFYCDLVLRKGTDLPSVVARRTLEMLDMAIARAQEIEQPVLASKGFCVNIHHILTAMSQTHLAARVEGITSPAGSAAWNRMLGDCIENATTAVELAAGNARATVEALTCLAEAQSLLGRSAEAESALRQALAQLPAAGESYAILPALLVLASEEEERQYQQAVLQELLANALEAQKKNPREMRTLRDASRSIMVKFDPESLALR